MKIPTCTCISEQWDDVIVGVDLPESIGFSLEVWFDNNGGFSEEVELALNFCPECGKQYEERECTNPASSVIDSPQSVTIVYTEQQTEGYVKRMGWLSFSVLIATEELGECMGEKARPKTTS